MTYVSNGRRRKQRSHSVALIQQSCVVSTKLRRFNKVAMFQQSCEVIIKLRISTKALVGNGIAPSKSLYSKNVLRRRMAVANNTSIIPTY